MTGQEIPESVTEKVSTDDAEWIGFKRDDLVRALRYRGHQRDAAKAFSEAIPDEVFQIIRSQAVEELAECYIVGMRATIRIHEALKYAKGMWPGDTDLSVAAKKARADSLRRLSGGGVSDA
ncbi:hypothetical protein [Mycetocola spongiae]|uniref:hypothetical protein n=1 Tax=Mycetocola spongiae TaxID=2859226 RepID=UPI001CF19D39|nr:hypothetical protein [Mycetocola spongiae]UCR89267.1 hypothetical protein KXZ72_00695 [Mycetocola spongiae]